MIAVAGTHGKTTTSSLIAYMLNRAGRDPTVMIGGIIATFDTKRALPAKARSSLLRRTSTTAHF